MTQDNRGERDALARMRGVVQGLDSSNAEDVSTDYIVKRWNDQIEQTEAADSFRVE